MKKGYIIAGIILVVIAIITGETIRNNSILKDDEKQADMLLELYRDMIVRPIVQDSTIVLDNSALKNFITKKDLSPEAKNTVKYVEQEYISGFYTYELSTEYKGKVLTVTLKGNDEMTYIQKYKLSVKNGEITFSRKGLTEEIDNNTY